MADRTLLLLGGAGLIGKQIAHEAARKMHPEKIIIASLYQREVREATTHLKKEFPAIEWIGVWGDVFLRADFQHTKRHELMESRARREALFDDLMGDLDAAYARSRLVQLILEHRPDVIVDSINTATAISYQDKYAASIVAKQRMDALFEQIEELTRTVRSGAPLPVPAGNAGGP